MCIVIHIFHKTSPFLNNYLILSTDSIIPWIALPNKCSFLFFTIHLPPVEEGEFLLTFVKKENQVFDSLHTFIIAFIIHFICPKQPLHSTLQAVLPQADQSDKYHDKITTSRIPQNISSYIQQKSHSNECFPVLHSESEMR